MNQCTYARQVKTGYEYGVIAIENVGAKNESRVYVPAGVAPTIKEALHLNNMAPSGHIRLGQYINPVRRWNDQ